MESVRAAKVCDALEELDESTDNALKKRTVELSN